ncbi:MAG: hypothetical protein N2508_14365, partial [Anaerolineae bacterium]|nr:hypothetical protein [Anaerolineae bacterium]
SRVELPPTILLNTNQAMTPIDTCYTRTVTVTVRNAGLLSVYSATLTETLPVGLAYMPGTTEVSTDTVHWQPGPDPMMAGQSLRWSFTSAAPLGPWLSRIRPREMIYLRYHVYASCPFAGGQLRIQTSYMDPCKHPHLTSASYFVMPVRRANLTLLKRGENLSRTSPAPDLIYAEPGETVVFTLTISAAGNAAPAREVVVTDTLPGNLIFQDATPGYVYSGGPPGGTINWTFDIIPPNTSVVLTITTVVSQPEGCTITDTRNMAEVAWGCPDGCRQDFRTALVALRTRPVYGTPVVQTNFPPATLHQCGGEITIALNNQGPPAYNVILTDTLPPGYIYDHLVGATVPPSGVVNLWGTVVFTWAVLPTGPVTVVFAVRNSAGTGSCAIPSGSNRIVLSYDDDAPDCFTTGPYSVMATTGINVIGPRLVVDKSPPSLTAQVGQRITWTLTVRNTGSGTAYNVVVTDVVDSSFTGVTATGGGVVAGNTVIWTLADLPPGGVWSAQVSAVLLASGVNRNVVTAAAFCDAGCVAASASDVAYVTLMQQFGKWPDVQSGSIGSLAVFTFTATLPDVDNIYGNVALTDTLPTGLGYVGAVLTYTWDAEGSGQGGPVTVRVAPTSAPGYLASGNIIWRLGHLTGTVQINGVITAVIQNIVANQSGVQRVNTLRLSYTDEGQPYSYTDTANVMIREPNLVLDKRVRSSTGSVTGLSRLAYLTYTLVITSNGNWPAYDVRVTDAVPAGIFVTGIYGGDARSAPSARPLTWTFSVIPPNTVVAVSYTARISGAFPNINLTNVATTTWTSTPDNPVGQERTGSDGPGGTLNDYASRDTVTIGTANIAFAKQASPPSTTNNPLRIGDVVTYTIVTTVPPGIYVPWPFQYDDLPLGVRYVTGTFSVTSTMPFIGPNPLASAASYDSRPNGVSGNTSTSNPRVGPSETNSAIETVEWWLDPLNNSASSTPGVVTVRFWAQLTGIDRNGTVQWTDPQGVVTLNNTARMYWNNTDSGAYNYSLPTQNLNSTVLSYVGQPLVHVNKTYVTPAGCNATLLEDAFNRSSLTTVWTSVSGGWNIDTTPGYARQSSSTNPAILVRDSFSASDFSYSAMVRSMDVDNSSSRGLVFRYTNTSNYYVLRLRQADGGFTNVDLAEAAGSTTPSTLQTAFFTPITGQWYHLEVRYENGRIRGYVDSRLLIDYMDTTPRPAGSVGFYANACAANACHFDDVFVTRLEQTSCYAGANDLITYTITISNQGRTPAYNIVVSDVLPAELTFVTSTLLSAPPGTAFTAQPAPGARGTITWAINMLAGTAPSAFSYVNQKTMRIRVVTRVTDTVRANIRFSNQVFLPYYDSQPGSGPTGTPIPSGTDADQRTYSDGSHSAGLQTVNGGIAKRVTFRPPPTATLGTLVTYTLIVPARPRSPTLFNVVVTDVVDSRLRIESVRTGGGTGASSVWAGRRVTATFASIPHRTQAYVTIT